ncbi:MAG: phytanoyl-CoA dioxygenase [Gemmatimonadetes bacterium]|nr:phytanoyl-CoA dioxygenase [Gemmatimonadota bacterium]|tara:strand:- start:399 stop:1184 length:786 start_codon:yes stop_codon:yes gene_type:complete
MVRLENPRPLTPEELEAYGRDGFAIVENLLTPAEVTALQDRVREYTHGDRSTEKLWIQTEPRVTRGEMKVDHPGDGIRKIGGLVEGDDLYNDLGKHPNIVGVIQQILGSDIKMFRNAMLLKPPEVGSQKGMHQDSPYWSIAPMDLCSCWYAVDTAMEENGCMGVLPGGHKRGPLPHVRVTDDFVVDENAYSFDEMILAPIPAGGGLFFHSLLPHYTAPNQSDRWRRAIALSYMSARSTYTGGGEGPEYYPISGKSFEGCVR